MTRWLFYGDSVNAPIILLLHNAPYEAAISFSVAHTVLLKQRTAQQAPFVKNQWAMLAVNVSIVLKGQLVNIWGWQVIYEVRNLLFHHKIRVRLNSWKCLLVVNCVLQKRQNWSVFLHTIPKIFSTHSHRKSGCHPGWCSGILNWTNDSLRKSSIFESVRDSVSLSGWGLNICPCAVKRGFWGIDFSSRPRP